MRDLVITLSSYYTLKRSDIEWLAIKISLEKSGT